MSTNDTSFDIKRLEYLQKKGLSRTAHRHVVGELSEKINEHNQVRRAEIARERARAIADKNEVLAKEAWNTHAKGRKII
jgi:hypothetical protein